MSADNGEPAFPAGRMYEPNEGWEREPGMTLRDYFAARVVPAILTGLIQERIEQIINRGESLLPDVHESAALGAYRLADAMLRERIK